MAETSYNKENVKNAAINLGRILDDMGDFEKLKPHWPNAGQFPLAQWLERIVDDRRNAIVAHGEHLHAILSKMEVTLKQIATDFDNTDGDNAKKIGKSLSEMEGIIKTELSELDENTEKDQNNFHSTDKKGSTDGDGYNDDLTVPVGQEGKEEDDKGDEDDDEDKEEKDDKDEDEELENRQNLAENGGTKV